MWPFTKKPKPAPVPHNCEVHGHDYRARYDDILSPRLTDISIMTLAFGDGLPREKYYVRDICAKCGDVIDRLQGDVHPLVALAQQAKK